MTVVINGGIGFDLSNLAEAYRYVVIDPWH